MKEETVVVYVCDYCGQRFWDKQSAKLHEECCPKNPLNLPCSECVNCLVDIYSGKSICIKGMNMDKVGGRIRCFFREHGTPKLGGVSYDV